MLKVVLLLDCNECGLSMEQALVCSLHDARDWQSAGYTLMAELQTLATAEGWDYYNNRMCCGVCHAEQQKE